MTIIVDASTARSGGGLVLARELLKRLPEWDSINWHVVASERVVAEVRGETLGNVLCYLVPDSRAACMRHVRRYQVHRELARRTNPGAVLWLGNYGVRMGRVANVVLVQVDTTAAEYAENWTKRITWHIVKAKMKHSMRLASAVITSSGYMQSIVVDRLGCDSRKVHIVPLSADMNTAYCEQSKTLGADIEGPYFLAVSGPQGYKNIEVLLEGARLLNQRTDRKYKLVVVGVDENTALRRGLLHYSDVMWLGRVDHACLPRLYRNARAYIHHSLAESFGIPILEAMQCGTVSVAADIPGIVSVYGESVPTFRPTAHGIAAILEQVTGDPVWLADTTKRQKEFARGLTWDRTVAGIVECVIDAAGSSASN